MIEWKRKGRNEVAISVRRTSLTIVVFASVISVVDFLVIFVVLKIDNDLATRLLRSCYAPTRLILLLSSADSPYVHQLRFCIRHWCR